MKNYQKREESYKSETNNSKTGTDNWRPSSRAKRTKIIKYCPNSAKKAISHKNNTAKKKTHSKNRPPAMENYPEKFLTMSTMILPKSVDRKASSLPI